MRRIGFACKFMHHDQTQKKKRQNPKVGWDTPTKKSANTGTADNNKKG